MKSRGSTPAVMAIALLVFATGLAMADKSDVQSLPRRALLQNVCDKCNVPLNQGGCKCDNNCNCLLGANKCDKCNVAVDQGGCKCNSNCDCITSTNPCDKCNTCKCDSNCNCITSSGGGTVYSGALTYYDDVGFTACGEQVPGDGNYAAISFALSGQLDTHPQQWPPSWCFRNARVTGPLGSAIVRVIDKCSACAYGDIDVTKSIFKQIGGPLSIGRVSGVKFTFI